MTTLNEQQLDTTREQLEHFEEITQGDWLAKDDLGRGLEYSTTILNRIKTLPTSTERFQWYKRFKIPMKLASFETEFLVHFNPEPFQYCEEVRVEIEKLNKFHSFEVLNVRLLRNQTGDMMSDED